MNKLEIVLGNNLIQHTLNNLNLIEILGIFFSMRGETYYIRYYIRYHMMCNSICTHNKHFKLSKI